MAGLLLPNRVKEGLPTTQELVGGRVAVPRLVGGYPIQLRLHLALARGALFPTSEVSVEPSDNCIQWRPVIYCRSGKSL
jgi:hypothetical protein